MSAVYLDPQNQAFVDALAGGAPLYEKSYVEARKILEDLQDFKPSSDIKQQEVDVQVGAHSVKTVVFRPAKAEGVLKMIFYTHGGGWILGSPTVHGSLMEDLARQTGAAVVFPYYTPAPEAQFPVQFEESYGVLDHFVKNASHYQLEASHIGVAGDSVGGNMAIAMTQLALARNLPAKIGQLVLFYPVTDVNTKSETYKTFQNGPYLAENTMDWMINAFLPNEADRRSELASPLGFAKDDVLAKFPPTTIFVSGADPLIGEGELFGHRLQKLGVDTAILKAEGVIHDYVLLKPLRDTATPRAVTELAALKLLKAVSGK